MKKLTDIINDDIIPAIYADPEKAFGGTWHRGSTAQRCREHLLTDGHPSHDRTGGTYIRYNRQHIIADGSDGGVHAEVVKFYQEQHSIGSRYDAAKALADIYGITFDVDSDWQPSPDYIQRQRERAADVDDVQAMARLTPDDSAEVSYLRARGITDELRRDNDIFAVTEQTEPLLHQIRKRNEGVSSPFPAGVKAHGTHTVGTPIYQHGKVAAIYFRTTSPDVTPKYVAWKVNKNTPVMFGLNNVATRSRRSLVIVEGVFDVVTAQAAIGGAYDIAGYLSASLTSEQARAIAAAGYRNVIQIVDYDGAAKASNTIGYVQRTAKTLEAEGLTALIVDLIDEAHPDVKQDANSFIQAFGAEAFRDRVKHSHHVTGYIVNSIARAAVDGTDEERSTARQDILTTLATEPSADVVNDILTREDSPTARLFGDVNVIRERLADARQKAADEAAEKERKRAIADKCAEVTEHARRGEYEEAKKCADEARRLIDGDGGTAGAWKKWTSIPSWSDMLAEYRKQGAGIRTGLYLRESLNSSSTEELVVPTGAMTFVTAPRGHGKTKMLQNMVLILAPTVRQQGKSIIAIHYEESRGDYINNLINITANHTFTTHNRRYIREVMQRANVIAADAAFAPAYELIKGLYEDGTIIPISETPTLEDIAAIAKDGAGHVAAIVLDYIQLVPTTSDVWSRKDEIRQVCKTLNDIARTTGIPIISASQFNRTVQAPTDMTATANADASEIEQFSSLDIGIWSSDEAPAKTSRTWYTPEGKLTPEAHDIAAAGLQFTNVGTAEGQNAPTLYMRILKDREGTRRLWNVFSFDGNIGKISVLPEHRR